ncbi:hypothetical protein H744_1c1478 [Photobacterium gaetbulicola Gung47]|uniref:SHOCT domain-containing protein n=2 Tax=Photobacterium gaetbulicola TaxID=1295392 RepID=A0A0C5WTX2_9GAMM|nr:hypothetical protein H744_1c1159 [Photobacterium gaetbulicola Gung47]AJR06500.1 hypothetical protein H744_1c1478 [Photobacterium gaetbulicola Gung47]
MISCDAKCVNSMRHFLVLIVCADSFTAQITSDNMLRTFIVFFLFISQSSIVLASTLESKLQQIHPDYRQWVSDSCPSSLGPSVWHSCFERNAKAISNNFPDKKLEKIPDWQRDWVKSTCPRSLGPSVWASCVNRNMRVFNSGFPIDAVNSLSEADRAWLNQSCPRSLGPSVWSSCINRNLKDLKPVETSLNQPPQSQLAWDEDSSSTEVDNTDDGLSLFIMLIMLIILGYLFFLPTIIARKRYHPHRTAILLLNLFGGLFLGIGWFLALIWCFVGNQKSMQGVEVAGEIERLYQLYTDGVISEKEFKKRKEKLLRI